MFIPPFQLYPSGAFLKPPIPHLNVRVDMTVILVEYEERELRRAVEEAQRMADGRSKLRAKLAMGVLLTIAALLVAAAFALAAPLIVTATVDYMYAPQATAAIVHIVINGAPNVTYGVEVRGPSNGIIALKEVDANESGLAVLELELPETYPAGGYTVYVSGGGDNYTTTFTIMWNVTIGAEKAVENLIRVATKLGAMVHCRNEVLLAANVTETEQFETFQAVLTLTEAGDGYLALANSSFITGNYTAAKLYAQLAIQSFGRALELQEEIGDELGVSFAVCKAVISPPKKEVPVPARNITCKWTPEFYPLMTAFNVTEHRIEELRALLAKLEGQDYNVTRLAMMLDQASELVEEGRQLAQTCNISEAAHKLGEATKLIGLVNAGVAKLGAKRFAHELAKDGVEINETEVREALRRGQIVDKIAEKIEEALRRLEEKIEDIEEKIEEKIERLERLMEKLPERAKERVGETFKRTIEKRQEALERVAEARKRGKQKP